MRHGTTVLTSPLAIASGGTGAVDASTAKSNLGISGGNNLIFHQQFSGLQVVESGSSSVVVAVATLPALEVGDLVHMIFYAQGGGTMSASGGVWLEWLRNGTTAAPLYTAFSATINHLQIQRFAYIRDTDFITPIAGDGSFSGNANTPVIQSIDRTQTQAVQMVFRSQNLTTTLHKFAVWVWRTTS